MHSFTRPIARLRSIAIGIAILIIGAWMLSFHVPAASALTVESPEGPIHASSGFGAAVESSPGAGFGRFNSVDGSVIQTPNDHDTTLESLSVYMYNQYPANEDIQFRVVVVPWNAEINAPAGALVALSEPQRIPLTSLPSPHMQLMTFPLDAQLAPHTDYFVALTTLFDANPSQSVGTPISLGFSTGGSHWVSQLALTPDDLTNPNKWVGAFAGSRSGTLAYTLTFDGAPVARTITPNSVPLSGQSQLTLTGENLSRVTAVTVDGEEVPFEGLAEHSLRFNAPPHPAGIAEVIVTNAFGSSAPLELTYTAPTLSMTLADITHTYGEAASLVALVSPSTADGEIVSFTVSGAPAGEGTLMAGKAPLQLPAAAYDSGTHVVAAELDSTTHGVAHATATLQVNQAETSVTYQVGKPNTEAPTHDASSARLTATIVGVHGTVPTGEAVLLDATGNELSKAVLNTDGIAEFAVPESLQGFLRYTGDLNHLPSETKISITPQLGENPNSPGAHTGAAATVSALSRTGADSGPWLVALGALLLFGSGTVLTINRLRARRTH